MALSTIQKFEGLKLTAYQDSVGIWTIGFGNIFNLDTGKPIKQGDVITQDTADRWLKIEVDQLQAKLQKVITVPLTDKILNIRDMIPIPNANSFNLIFKGEIIKGDDTFAKRLIPQNS
jgi:GH24 family phage-related lysozyme (muramidase)